MNLLAQTTEFLALGQNAPIPSDPSINTVVANRGEIPIGSLVICFLNEGQTEAVVNGVPLQSGEASNYDFIGKGYEAIPYTVGQEGRLKIRYSI